jgi:glycerol uptake facilitator-like aquaporin
MLLSIGRRAVAEAIGTSLLLTAIVGSGIMADHLAAGDAALALLANTMATATTLAALILAVGPISGAHFNPWVTMLMRLRGKLPAADVWPYVTAQFVGAFVGVAVAHLMFGEPVFAWSDHTRSGAAQTVAEAVATFGLLLIIGLSAAARSSHTAIAVGAFIAGAYWFTSSTSFANPAVTLARASTHTFAGIRPADVPSFLLGQSVGAGAAVLVLHWLLTSDPETAR